MFGRAAALLYRLTYARYIAASAGALAVDGGLFLALLHLGCPATAASIIGYAMGIGAHWLLSSRAVFTSRLAGSAEGRARQKALFLGSALVGLAITAVVVTVGERVGIDLRLAKLIAIGISFQATYMLRKSLVFAA